MKSKNPKAPQIADRTNILARIASAVAPTETAVVADVLAQATAAAQPGQEPEVARPLNDMNPVADWEPGGRTRVMTEFEKLEADLEPVFDAARGAERTVQVFKLQVGTTDDGRIAIRKADEHGAPVEDWQVEPSLGPAAPPAACMPINDLADARALPDVTHGVYQRAEFSSPNAIRAFRDHDGRTMAVVWTGYTLAKAAITD